MSIIEAAKDCAHGFAPPCENACPFGLDIRAFINRMQSGRFGAALRIYAGAVVFPGIVSSLCSAPCQHHCFRNKTDSAVALPLLEQAALSFCGKQQTVVRNLAEKPQRIAIIGAGMSGIAAAERLAEHQYQVDIYEAAREPGGCIRDLLSPEVYEQEIRAVLGRDKVKLHLNRLIRDLKEVEADAIYIATGSGGEDLQAQKQPGCFSGGMLRGADAATAIADGLRAALAIEAYFKTGSMEQRVNARPVLTALDPRLLRKTPPLPPLSGAYSREEAIEEAKRCLKCDCDLCLRQCALMSYYQQTANSVAMDAEGTVNPTDMELHRINPRLIASCDQCGLCPEDCFQHIDLCSHLLEARRAMVDKGELSPAFSAFWLNDMAHADSPVASLIEPPPQGGRAEYAFFPGCQLGASDHRYIGALYQRLLDLEPATGLMLECCGAPAHWAAKTELSAAKTATLRQHWRQLGEPTLIFACPSCRKLLREYCPEIPGISLYELDLGQPLASMNGMAASVYDPCSSRHDIAAQQKARAIAQAAGCMLQPLPYERDQALCCGWGGQYRIANPNMYQKTVADRINMAKGALITYCVNCRDSFIEAGAETYHVLDLLLGINLDGYQLPDRSRRRYNREATHDQMAADFWGKGPVQPGGRPPLYISAEVSDLLHHRWIVDQEALDIILQGEASGRKLYDQEQQCFICHGKPDHLTYWVVYRPEGQGYRLLNAYTHRMNIKGEYHD